MIFGMITTLNRFDVFNIFSFVHQIIVIFISTHKKKFVKYTESSELIFATGFFSKFYKKLSLINTFSVRFIYLPVKSTKLGFFRIL